MSLKCELIDACGSVVSNAEFDKPALHILNFLGAIANVIALDAADSVVI